MPQQSLAHRRLQTAVHRWFLAWATGSELRHAGFCGRVRGPRTHFALLRPPPAMAPRPVGKEYRGRLEVLWSSGSWRPGPSTGPHFPIRVCRPGSCYPYEPAPGPHLRRGVTKGNTRRQAQSREKSCLGKQLEPTGDRRREEPTGDRKAKPTGDGAGCRASSPSFNGTAIYCANGPRTDGRPKTGDGADCRALSPSFNETATCYTSGPRSDRRPKGQSDRRPGTGDGVDGPARNSPHHS